MIDIPGDYLEGGGAILRVASALSALTSTNIRVFNIRKNRPKPGLQTQHLEGLKAITALCDGKLDGGILGSTEIIFRPGKITAKKLSVNISTAGSTGLIFQSLALPASRAKKTVIISITGGATFGKFAPPLPAFQATLLPLLEKMGYLANIRIEREGFYPAGGARTEIVIEHCPSLKPLILPSLGKISHIGGLSVETSHLHQGHVAQRQAREAERFLTSKGFSPLIKETTVEADCPGSGILLFASDGRTVLESDSLGERGKKAEEVGREAAQKIFQCIESGATVDEHISDQLLLFMAFAQGTSSILAPRLTRHAETNMWLIKKFLPVSFRVEKKGKAVLIECSGSGK